MEIKKHINNIIYELVESEKFNDTPTTFYHVSPIKNKSNILKYGLTTGNKKRYNNISKDVIYLWKYKELALWYALTEARDNNVAFDIYEIKNVFNVEEDISIGIPEAYFTVDDILPDNMVIIDSVTMNDTRLNNIPDIEDIIDELT